MRDPFSWSFPIGRIFGITIKIHILFPLVAVGLVLRATYQDGAPTDIWIDASMLVALLFVTVLLHEFGHCICGRWVGGEANEVLLWPLGGLAAVDVPHSARANFITAAGGPLVNVLICLASGLALAFALDGSYRPPLNPLWYPVNPHPGSVGLTSLDGSFTVTSYLPTVILARLFWVSWVNFLLNVLLIGYPLDGGRMFQCILWPYVGYRQATLYAVYAGFTTMFLLLVVSLFKNEVLLLILAFFIYTSCKQQWVLLETGGDDSLFGYDFSQGYTSLERDQPPPPPRKQANFFQRWRQRRAAKKLQRQQLQQMEEDTRMDQLLEKIKRFGKASLTEEENRFLKRVAERYRNRP